MMQDSVINRMQRLVDFNAMLKEVNHTIARAHDGAKLLQSFCDIAVRYGHLKVAFIAQPDESGTFQILAASGEIGYVQGLHISTDPNIPEGQGAAGRAWRDGKAYYHQSFLDTPFLATWAERAVRYGIQSTATVIVRLHDQNWGILSIYHPERDVFNEDLQALFEELALDISFGLERLNVIERERQQAALQKTLLDNTIAGISMVRGRRFVHINDRFANMLGYHNVNDLIGQDTRVIYPNAEAYEHVGNIYDDLVLKGHASAQNVRLLRRDGQAIVVDVEVGMILENDNRTTVWTLQDVTERHQLLNQLQHQAFHDSLTDLPNRRALDREFTRLISIASRDESVIAVGVLDLDDFKDVNDSLGHGIGDQVLKEFSNRIRTKINEGVYLSRIGGDEFVVIVHGLNRLTFMQQLEQVMNDLHEAVELPFELGDGQAVLLDMSLGLALYPFHGDAGDYLIRQADAALYQLKDRKRIRQIWWQIGTINDLEPNAMEVFDPYGEEAFQLLQKAQMFFAEVENEFITKAFEYLETDSHAIPYHESAAKRFIVTYKSNRLRVFFEPTTTQSIIRDWARELGVVYALMGTSASLLMKFSTLYSEIMAERIRKALLPARERYLLMQIVEARILDELMAVLEEGEFVTSEYFNTLLRGYPDSNTRWVDLIRMEIDTMATLPGIRGAMLARMSAAHSITVEYSSGQIIEISPFMKEPELVVHESVRFKAWRSQQIHSLTSDHPADDKTRDLRSQNFAIQSQIVIPVLERNGPTVAAIELFGEFQNQFESSWMRRFAMGLQQRWSELWQRRTDNEDQDIIPQNLAKIYRQQLFSGGLLMYVQPIVDLARGTVVCYEALARLKMNDGSLVSPGTFLPLLGEVELTQLFLLSLDQALEFACNMGSQGKALTISVNVPPSTLILSDFPVWVDQAIQKYGILPEHLTLEVLESQKVDLRMQNRNILRLKELGVRLAMDDLGSGYSSLNRLVESPFETIKIDSGVLKNIHTEPVQNLILLNTLIQLGRDLQRSIIVEGLENPGYIEVASILGAPLGQGYAFARPMSIRDVIQWEENFRTPIEHGQVNTFLGALTYHWKTSHQAHASDFLNCPITHFLNQQGVSEPVLLWHKQLHEGNAREDTTANLMNWFIEQNRKVESLTIG